MLTHWFEQLVLVTDLQREENNPFGCGEYLEGHGESVTGYAWYYPFKTKFAVAKCDFVFTKDVHLKMDETTQYLGLRLDYAQFLPPGKILAFFEEKEETFEMHIKSGTRFAYTEVLYTEELYSGHFHKAFAKPNISPLEVIRNMSGNSKWSSHVTNTLLDISRSTLSGPAAELFFIGKSYELLSALIEMETRRIPHKASDIERIQNVLQYIQLHFKENIRQEDLVRIADMSPTKLKTLFKRFTEKSISDYILDK